MNLYLPFGYRALLAIVYLWLVANPIVLCAQVRTDDTLADEIKIVMAKGTVEVSPDGATTWVLSQTNQVLHPFDRLRTGSNSLVSIRWSGQSVAHFGGSTLIEVQPPDSPMEQSGLRLFRGILSFFFRDKPGRLRVI